MSIKSRFILKLRKNDEINNTPSNNNIFGRFLKDGANILAISITQVHNLSIKQPSHFPTSCKVAFKKVSKTDPKTFRPIFHLHIISRILKKIIHDQTMENSWWYVKNTPEIQMADFSKNILTLINIFTSLQLSFHCF